MSSQQQILETETLDDSNAEHLIELKTSLTKDEIYESYKPRDLDLKNLLKFFGFAYVWTFLWWGTLGLLANHYVTKAWQKWALLPGGLIGAAGPSLSSAYLIHKNNGKPALKHFLKRGCGCKSLKRWQWVLLIFPVLMYNFFALGCTSSGIHSNKKTNINLLMFVFLPLIFLIIYIGGPVQEEYGWRGYALDRLLFKFNATISSLLLGFIWGFWHLPLFFIKLDPHSSMNLWVFVWENMSSSIIYTFLHKNTSYKNNITLAILLHMSGNSLYYPFHSKDENLFFFYYTIAQTIFAVILCFIFDWKTLEIKSIK